MTRDRFGAIARYILAVLLLMGLYLGTGSQWLLGLLLLLLLLPPASLAANLYVRNMIQVSVMLPTTAAKGTACMGTVQMANRAWLPAARLYCKVGMINDLTREENRMELIASIGPRGCHRRDFLMESAHCGRVYTDVQSLQILDWFGLFALRVPVKASARITILPELFSCDVVPSPVSAVSDEDTVSRRGDDRTEVFQLREYQSGDDIRQIHWKLSSKLDTLLLKEPSQSVSRSLLVFWDKRGACSPENMDAMAEVAASVCQSLCDNGTAFDLGWTEKDELELRQIRDGDTLLQTIPALVTQAGAASCPEPDQDGYGQVIYITSQIPEEAFSERVTYLICTDEAYEDGKSVVFSWRNYSERLERLEF